MITQDHLCLQRAKQFIMHKKDKTKPYIIFDIGANKGAYANLIYSMINAKHIVYSFEPNLKAFQMLKQNCPQTDNYKVFNIGFSSSIRDSILYDPGNKGSEIASLYNREVFKDFKIEDQPTEIPIKLSTVDNFLHENNIDQVHYMKIDVEGHELEVLLGANDSFNKKLINAGQFEFGSTFADSNITIEDCVAFFTKHNYSLFFNDVLPSNIVKKTSDIQSVDNWENILFINNEFL